MWPNDLVVDQRKTSRLLCERSQRVDLIGVGINVNAGGEEAPADLRERSLMIVASVRVPTPGGGALVV
jgi:biotin-(acetyl-CoA carboxylase) ligase